jgi:hypothetical protein
MASMVSLFLYTPYGDGSAHDARLRLPVWLGHWRVSRYAHRVAWSPSPHTLLAGLQAV